jgi:hypothetical protein
MTAAYQTHQARQEMTGILLTLLTQRLRRCLACWPVSLMQKMLGKKPGTSMNGAVT